MRAPELLNGIEEPSHEELMFLDRFHKDPSRVDSVLAEEVETSEDVFTQGDALVHVGEGDLLAFHNGIASILNEDEDPDSLPEINPGW